MSAVLASVGPDCGIAETFSESAMRQQWGAGLCLRWDFFPPSSRTRMTDSACSNGILPDSLVGWPHFVYFVNDYGNQLLLLLVLIQHSALDCIASTDCFGDDYWIGASRRYIASLRFFRVLLARVWLGTVRLQSSRRRSLILDACGVRAGIQ